MAGTAVWTRRRTLAADADSADEHSSGEGGLVEGLCVLRAVHDTGVPVRAAQFHFRLGIGFDAAQKSFSRSAATSRPAERIFSRSRKKRDWKA